MHGRYLARRSNREAWLNEARFDGGHSENIFLRRESGTLIASVAAILVFGFWPSLTSTSLTDTSLTDTSVTDTSVTDTSVTDISITDISITDISITDTSVKDIGVADTGVTDINVTDIRRYRQQNQ
jgi:hypothetical protein